MYFKRLYSFEQTLKSHKICISKLKNIQLLNKFPLVLVDLNLLKRKNKKTKKDLHEDIIELVPTLSTVL